MRLFKLLFISIISVICSSSIFSQLVTEINSEVQPQDIDTSGHQFSDQMNPSRNDVIQSSVRRNDVIESSVRRNDVIESSVRRNDVIQV